jgi:uncharacterized protein (UPF0335 family)
MQETETTTTVNNISGKELLTIIERIENAEERIGGLQDDRKCVYAESKSRGFEPKVIRKIVQIRKRNKIELEEEQALMDIYTLALGMDAED